MPYRQGQRLAGEQASRIGHLDVLKSELVNRLVQSFETRENLEAVPKGVRWIDVPEGAEPLALIFSVDGSVQPIEANEPPNKAIAFVKTALLRIDQYALSRIDQDNPHPFALRDILADSALYHSTVFPLRNVSVPGMTNYDAIRQIIFESVKDSSLDGEPLETLKWIVYEKWSGRKKRLPLFDCPHCERMVATLKYDEEEGKCPSCNGHLFVTDMLGFHLDMTHDAAPNRLATDYMSIHETLLLFTGVRHFWETSRAMLTNCLFVKDGPLSLWQQYAKLVAPIRRFLALAQNAGYPVHVIGQEKTGAFADHLALIGLSAPECSMFIPDDVYIKEKIQHRPHRGEPYGMKTNYGVKIFVKIDSYQQMVLNVPGGISKENPALEDLIGIDRIVATLPTILSSRYEGGLLPVELAHGIASLSTYPSAQILKIFSEAKH